MASPKSWRRTHQVRSGRNRAQHRAKRTFDESRCAVVSAEGIRCPNKAVDLGYCSTHWGR